jgi:hypothetical protein
MHIARCNMHIARCNMHIAMESILPLTWIISPQAFGCLWLPITVIGYGIGGNDIPAKWHNSLKASC